MNNVSLIGNLTADPDLKVIGESANLCTFTLAVNKGKDKVSFIPIKSWNKTAEFIAKYFNKGQKIAITGFIDQETWEVDDQRKSKLVIVATNAEFCNRKEQKSDSKEEKVPFEV